ncbi:MAG: aminotransferase class V-fold PLP-dependent enzyme [Cytophagales bacterium]|nr:aminotransferase class V-fold PLP-dependent enzyme [Bernardetiaceae bacterium]MDW8211413.1 aminotransferase class V-fold PLP-dependent enzyme [Cytophagales bacterium]
MNHVYFLTPGPSQLYYTVPQHIKTALKEHICSISHRSKSFQQIVAHALEHLRALFQLPTDYYIAFTASATEVWERAIENLSQEYTLHLVNGNFSKKFYEFSKQLKRNAQKWEVSPGKGFYLSEMPPFDPPELLCLTHNETSTGVTMPLEDIYTLRKRYPEALIIVDAVSSVPYPEIDFSQIDSLFFSVQKGFGLPAGLGVWIFNQRCLAKAEELLSKGKSIGTYHSLPSLLASIQKNETPETPNVLGIYLLGKVAEDMNRRGIKTIRQEIEAKAAIAYHHLQKNNDKFSLFVNDPSHRSATVIVAEVLHRPAADFIEFCKQKGIVLGSGYGNFKGVHIRIANFPTHAKETFQHLADLMAQW